MSLNKEIKQVVLCADDFGMSDAIDTGIIRLAAQGRLSAASCLSQGPTFKAHALGLAGTGAQTGLHLNFTEPMGAPGLFLPLGALIRSAYARKLDLQAVRAQTLGQLEAFESELGRAPDFVDGHQHVHQLPQIREAVLQILAGRYPEHARPWLRSTCAVSLAGIPLRQRGKARVIQALGAGTFRRIAGQQGFHLNRRFAGVYDFRGKEAGYARLLSHWLACLQDGDLLMCHPAAHADSSDPMGAQRVAEFNVLSGDDAGRWLQENSLHGLRTPFGLRA